MSWLDKIDKKVKEWLYVEEIDFLSLPVRIKAELKKAGFDVVDVYYESAVAEGVVTVSRVWTCVHIEGKEYKYGYKLHFGDEGIALPHEVEKIVDEIKYISRQLERRKKWFEENERRTLYLCSEDVE